MSTTPNNTPNNPPNNTPAPSKTPKPHTEAFWEALVRRGVSPEQAAPHLPNLSEFEIAAEMTKARCRLAEAAGEEECSGEDEDEADLPAGRERSCWGLRVRSSRGIR